MDVQACIEIQAPQELFMSVYLAGLYVCHVYTTLVEVWFPW